MADQAGENLYGLLKDQPNRIYVIADAGLNHGGNKERALALVRAARWAGADAVKFHTFRAGRPASTPASPSHVRCELTLDAFRALHKESRRLEIEFLSTPLDEECADFLDELGVSAFKIAPGDITHRPLIEHVSRKGKPVLLSTGMSAADEIEKAIDWMHSQSNEQIVLLHCTSSYPAKPVELNLKTVQYLRDGFGIPVGFSDHSAGTLGSIVAASLGAQVIERPFMIETRGDARDQAVSMDAKTLKSHIEELRLIGAMLGDREKFAPASRRPLYPMRTASGISSLDFHAQELIAVANDTGMKSAVS